jgi:predicted branched-subunit amino acid permease
MDRKEIKAQVVQLLSEGVAKSDVFTRLTGQGVKDRLLAYLIASHADPERCRANRGHLLAIRIIAWLQVVIGVLVGYAAGSEISPVAGLIVAALAAAFTLLFVWGFSKNNAGAYNAYLILTITQLPRQFSGFEEHPVSTLIGLLIGLALLAYVWYVRTRIFPDFNFIAPRKVNGKYVFSE